VIPLLLYAGRLAKMHAACMTSFQYWLLTPPAEQRQLYHSYGSFVITDVIPRLMQYGMPIAM